MPVHMQNAFAPSRQTYTALILVWIYLMNR